MKNFNRRMGKNNKIYKEILTALISCGELILFLMLSAVIQFRFYESFNQAEAIWHLLIIVLAIIEIYYFIRTIKFNKGYASLPLTISSLYYFQVMKKNFNYYELPVNILILLGIILVLRIISLFILRKRKVKSYFDDKAIGAAITVDFMSVLLFLLTQHTY